MTQRFEVMMRRRRRGRCGGACLLAAASAGCLAVAPSARGAMLVTHSGKICIGPASFGAAGIAVGGHASQAADIACFQNSRRMPLFMPHGILLTNGSALRGRGRMTSAAFHFHSDAFGKMTIPASQLQAIVYAPTPATRFGRLAARPPCVILKNHATLRGAVAWMDRRAIGFRCASGLVRIAKSRLQCLVLRRPALRPPGQSRRFIRLKNGDLWTARTVTDAAAGLVANGRQIPWDAVAALWTVGPHCVPLTSLTRLKSSVSRRGRKRRHGLPASPMYINYLRRGFLADRGPRHGQYFETGIGCRPGATAPYKIGAGYKTFVAALAVNGRASIAIQVDGDGKTLLRRKIRPGAAQWIHVQVSGIKTLGLKTLVGRDKLLTPQVIWGDAYLLK